MAPTATSSPLLPNFTVASNTPKPRLILNVEGLDKAGKTNFAFTAPGPLAYLNFDIGDEGVIDKFQSQKQILIPKEPYSVRFDGNKQREADEELKRFKADFSMALRKCRTVVADTGTEMWELQRLADHGKLTKVMPHQYVETNQRFRDLIREAFEHDANLILLHKLKAEWKEGKDGKSNKTGNYERAGFSEIGFLVQLNCRAYRVGIADREEGDLGFRLEILNCRQNPELQGMVLENDLITFQFLGSLVYPDMDPSVWE